jgi:hypothetical protein
VLGRGAFGKVYRATWRDREVASPRHKYPDRNPDLTEIYYVFEYWCA